MIILGIESSCDETGCAIVQKNKIGIKILSNVVASSAKLQEKFGGVIPEQAAREQIKSIIPVIEEALKEAKLEPENIDAIAVTYGPGLIGSLLVGVETAKILAKVWNKPLIPVNHLLGHFYANWIGDNPIFPAIGLLISGGHTDLILFQDHNKFEYLGGTRDDAAGECFDKCARLLNLPYPGGPNLAKLAEKGNPKTFSLPRPMISSKDFDFSFSGLKTAVANLLTEKGSLPPKELADLAASIEQSIIDVLVKKAIKAAQTYNIDQIIVAGGVAANQTLQHDLRFKIHDLGMKTALFIPPLELCTDNAAMIATAALFINKPIDLFNLQVDPNLFIDNSTNQL